MKIINPSVSIVKEDNPLKKIELAGRTCYKSESKITDDSSKKFVEMIIKRGHESVLEHVRFAFRVPFDVFEDFKEFKYFSHSDNPWSISGNVRAWRDYFKKGKISWAYWDLLALLKIISPVFFKDIPYVVHKNFRGGIVHLTPDTYMGNEALAHTPLTARFVCDRGVSHELVRHRVASFSQESTRYCDYNGEMTFIKPCFDWTSDIPIGVWDESCCAENLTLKACHWLDLISFCDSQYKYLCSQQVPPQEARSILPNSLKTEVVMTATYKEWEDILKLRLAKAAHPQMREVMQMLVALPDFPKEIKYSLED